VLGPIWDRAVGYDQALPSEAPDLLVVNRYLGHFGGMLDSEQKNQIQPDEQQAECDPSDRYEQQNVHDRGPPRWPSTDLKIYAA
jgi:hypothetical protein